MEFIAEYGMFLAKFLTVVLVIIIAAGSIFILFMRTRAGVEGHLDVRNLNQKYETMNLLLNSQILPKKEFKKSLKEHKAEHKKREKQTGVDEIQKRIFVLDFKGDIKATDVASLREEITAVLTVAKNDDEVVVLIESSGGTVHGYGLAASQLKRIRDKGIKLTVAVDKIAASGGYMMACVANKIIAAPFAIIGSIGVLAQIPNFYRLLKKHEIDFEQITAGEYKRTLTLFGENTDADREKLKEELEETHQLFKDFILDNRKQVEIEKIATGEHWYGKRALELNLVDELKTSDDYLCSAATNADIYEIDYIRKKPFSEKIISIGAKLFDHFS
ncbi:MAG: non-proteolytic protein, peptidase family [Gammaproteobacteria bacterium]|nr:non-proteolytic protein, peptidase family [Gammaproteobacteria bacterium]